MTGLFRPAAAADVEHAHTWYESQRSGLGEQFLSAVGTTVEKIIANLRQYPVLYRQTRRALLKRFPYAVFYRVIEGEVLVVACMHAKRAPERWRVRG